VITHYLDKALMFISLKQMLPEVTYLALEGVVAQSLVLENIHVVRTCQQEEGEEKEVLVS